MKQAFTATLTGSDSPITGVAKQTSTSKLKNAWQFDSLDDTLHLVIAEDDNGKWQRIAGTEPYLSGWTDELAEQVAKHD
jgi:hypothetical protein